MSAALFHAGAVALDLSGAANYACEKGITVAAVAQLVEQLIRNQAPSFKQFLKIITLKSSSVKLCRRTGFDLMSAALAVFGVSVATKSILINQQLCQGGC